MVASLPVLMNALEGLECPFFHPEGGDRRKKFATGKESIVSKF